MIGPQVTLSAGMVPGQACLSEVVVRIGGAGVCHSDLSMINGTVSGVMPYPFVMGHEFTGEVIARSIARRSF